MQRTKPLTTKATKDHEGFRFQLFPSCTFVALVVNDLANCTTTLGLVAGGRLQFIDHLDGCGHVGSGFFPVLLDGSYFVVCLEELLELGE
jgi:hypothetical protein